MKQRPTVAWLYDNMGDVEPVGRTEVVRPVFFWVKAIPYVRCGWSHIILWHPLSHSWNPDTLTKLRVHVCRVPQPDPQRIAHRLPVLKVCFRKFLKFWESAYPFRSCFRKAWYGGRGDMKWVVDMSERRNKLTLLQWILCIHKLEWTTSASGTC